jgi:hypothetical protein
MAAAAGRGESLCKPAGDLNGLELRTTAGYPDCRYVGNPFQDDYKKDGAQAKFCWLTNAQVAAQVTCDKAYPPDRATRPFSLAVCNGADCLDPRERILPPHGLSDILLHSKNSHVAVIYSPEGTEPRDDDVVLRVEWSGPIAKDKLVHQYPIQGIAGPSATYRHKLSLYLGGSYLYSRDDFGKAFPELRLLVESRPVDRFLSCRRAPQLDRSSRLREKRCPSGRRGRRCREDRGCDRSLFWPNVRVYGDIGLTSANAQETGMDQASAFKGTRAFDGSVGLGLFGFTFEVPSDPHDTRVFSLLPIARVGITSLPGAEIGEAESQIETLPFNDFFGLRLENEDGHFAGAYVELGFGQSNQFPFQRTDRMKTEAFVPFLEPGTIRLAARLQVDRPSPFGGKNSPEHVRDANGQPVEESEARRLIDQGNVRITLMFNIDVRRLFDFIGATGP